MQVQRVQRVQWVQRVQRVQRVQLKPRARYVTKVAFCHSLPYQLRVKSRRESGAGAGAFCGRSYYFGAMFCIVLIVLSYGKSLTCRDEKWSRRAQCHRCQSHADEFDIRPILTNGRSTRGADIGALAGPGGRRAGAGGERRAPLAARRAHVTLS
ncbi:hypothetical protein EVAR_17837_1 [Eumeta japonica]|uniref:Uncharacterized protein n=1 Tax=Eumeta variegata TaxID=151549 RepID=A0A4C1TTX3_EUMVA|nr:hypothetical protein EVAR_17837_1 [Eumeta japonica]